jgi:hypothetical protein
MAEPKLTYGLDSNGRLINVDDVPRGMACNCTCPECGAKLESRQGKKNQHHFAHANGVDCSGARMTALHMLAQQIIQEEKKIRTPWFKDYYEDPSKLIYFETVLLEQRFKTAESNRRPDCVGIIKKGDIEYKVWIEIKVKHAIDEEKKKDIIKLGAICMEIDISALLNNKYTEDSVRKALFDVYDNKEWINHPILFNNNDIIKYRKENKERRREEEEKLKQEEERIRELENQKRAKQELNQKIKIWLQEGSKEQSIALITEIQNHPYKTPNNKFIVYDFLVGRNDLMVWFNKSPKNHYALDLFYTILFYYYKNLLAINSLEEINDKLIEYSSKISISVEDRIFLEELVSIKIFYELSNVEQIFQLHGRGIDFLKELRKKYCCNKEFRNDCLKVLSVLYGHILGSDVSNFLDLTEEMINTCKSVILLYFDMLNYTYANNCSEYNIPAADEKQIIRLKNYIEQNNLVNDQDSETLIKLSHHQIYGNSIEISTDNGLLTLNYE